MATLEPQAVTLTDSPTKFAVGMVPYGIDEFGTAAPLDFTAAAPVTGDELVAIEAALTSTDPVQVYSANSYKRILDDNLVKTGPGSVSGFTVGAAGTTITVTFYDGTSTGGTIMFGPYTLVAGAPISFPGGAAFGVGLWVEFSGTTGTPNITVFYR